MNAGSDPPYQDTRKRSINSPAPAQLNIIETFNFLTFDDSANTHKEASKEKLT